jgi:hypothetical protein
VLGETQRAGELYDLVVDCLDWTGAVCAGHTDCRLIERVAGIAAAAAGRFHDANDHFRTALRQAAELPHVPEQAHTRRWYARMLIDWNRPGDRGEGSGLATEAAGLDRRMGMPRHAAMAETLARQLASTADGKASHQCADHDAAPLASSAIAAAGSARPH